MKKAGTCPKCGSRELVKIPGQAGAHGAGNNIPAGWTIFSSVKVTRYLCSQCGFSEEWIDSRADRMKLRDHYG
jgi:predicted nucleic-acid-binding Zn-ribbon protein